MASHLPVIAETAVVGVEAAVHGAWVGLEAAVHGARVGPARVTLSAPSGGGAVHGAGVGVDATVGGAGVDSPQTAVASPCAEAPWLSHGNSQEAGELCK